MEKSVVILGLSRQAKLFGLPMPYAMGVGSLVFLPFIITKAPVWLLTTPIWYLGARAITARNPNVHQVLATTVAKTPYALFRKTPRRYAEKRTENTVKEGRARAVLPKDNLGVYRQLPYLVEVSDEVVQTRDNALMLSFEIEGIDGLTAGAGAVESLRGQLAEILNGLDDRWTFYIHRAMRPGAPKLAPLLGDSFAADVEQAWQAETARRQPREHFLVLTVVRKQDNKAPLPFLARAARKVLGEDTEKRMGELTEIASILRTSLPIKTKPMKVSDGSLLGFYTTLLTGHFGPKFRGDMTLIAEDVATASATMQGDYFVVRSGDGRPRFGAMLYCDQYSDATWPGMLDGLDTGLDTIVTHSFTPIERNDITDRVKRRVSQMQAAGDLAARVQAQLFVAADDTESGIIGFGDHQLTITVFADSREALNEAVSRVRAIGKQVKFNLMREEMGMDAAYFATHPGNMDHRCRMMILSGKNFADIAALHTADVGVAGDRLPWRTPITLFETMQGSTHAFSFHPEGDPKAEPTNGHTLVLGPSGGGKTATISFIAAQAQRAGVRTILFDKEFGLKMATAALGGTYAQIRAGEPTGFNPLLTESGDRGEAWLLDWLISLLESTGPKLTPEQSQALASAVRQNMIADKHLRNFREFATLIGDANDDRNLAMRVAEWGPRGRYAWVFGEAEKPVVDFAGDRSVTGVDLTEILDFGIERTAVLSYLFRRLDTLMEDRHPMLVIIDEAAKVLNDNYFAAKLKDWLVTARKKNVVVVMMTQFPSQIVESKAGSILEGLPTQFMFPNREAKPDDYSSFNLSDNELGFLLSGVPGKRAALLRNARGSTLLNVDLKALGPLLTALGGGRAGETAFGADYQNTPNFWKKGASDDAE